MGAIYGGTFTGALVAIPGLVALAMCRQGPGLTCLAGSAGMRPRDLANPGLPLGFAVEDGFVLQAIVAREPAHHRTLRPIVEHPAHIFPRNACHGGEV